MWITMNFSARPRSGFAAVWISRPLLGRCFDYLKAFLPITGVHLILYEQDQGDYASSMASLVAEGYSR